MESTVPRSPRWRRALSCLTTLLLSLCMAPMALAGLPPGLSITASTDPVVAGSGSGNLVYTIQADNLYGVELSIALLLPAGVNLEQVIPANLDSPLNNDPCCAWTPLDDNDTLTLILTVDGSASPDAQVEVLAQWPDSNISATEITAIIAGNPILSLSLSDDPDPVLVGNNLEYQLVIDNIGNGPSSSIDYQITLAPEVSYLSGGLGDCSLLGSDVLSCLLTEPLLPGSSVSIPIQVLVNSVPPTNGEQSDPLLFAFAEIFAGPNSISASEETLVLVDNVNNGPDLSIRKSAPTSASVGDIIDYSLVVRNNDIYFSASAVEVVDYLPYGVTLLSAPGCEISSSGEIPAKTGAVVTCPLEVLSPQTQRSFSLQVQVDTCVDNLFNQAGVSYPSDLQNPPDPPGMDPDPGNDMDSAVTTCSVLPGDSADLSIVKRDGSDPVPAGGLLSYSLQVRNNGPDTAEQILVRDRLPDGISVVDLPPGCRDERFQVSCSLASLAAGEQQRFTISTQVAPDTEGQLRNTATVSSDTPDPVPDNNRDTEFTRVIPPAASADLLLEIDAPASVPPGTRFEYQLVIMNAGVDSAESVVLSSTLPDTLSLVASAPSQGSCETAESLRCELGSLDSGASATITLTVDLDPGFRGEILTSARVDSSTPDPDPDNNRDTAQTVVSLTQVDLPPGAICSRYRVVLEGPGSAKPLTPAPAGLGFFEEQGSLVLAGVPEVAGDYRILVNFQADDVITQLAFDLSITDAQLSIPDPTPVPGQRLPPASVDASYGFQLRALGGNEPYRWETTAELPAGLDLYPSGLLAGYPRQSGDVTLPVQVRDALDNTASITLRLQVLGVAVQDQTPPLPAGLVGLRYRAPALLDGPAPLFCTIETGELPAGLELGESCQIQGIPQQAGDYSFSLRISSTDPALVPLIVNRLLRVVADTPIPQGQPPQLTALPPVSIPVPPQCLAQLPPDELIQQGAVDPFGNRYLVGHIRVQEQYDLLLRKYDPEGNPLWEQRFDGGGEGLGYGVTVTPDLHIVAVGLLNDGDRYRGVVLQYDPSGSLIRAQQIDRGQVTALYGVSADPQGIYLAGERYNGQNFDGLLMALEPGGQIRWEATRDTRDTETAHRVVLLPCADGANCELVVGGFTGRDRNQGWLERRDRQGNLLASRVLADLPVESLIVDAVDGDLLLGGATDSGWQIRRLDRGFDTRWSATYPAGEALRAMANDHEANIYAVGRVSNALGDQDGFLLLLSPTGEALDQVRFDESEDERLTAVMIGPAGRLSVAGQRRGDLGDRVLLLEVDNGKRFVAP